jgi:Flp pilus assembly protein TadB
MYYEQPRQRPQKEPSGCLQTIVISKMIVGILLIPIALILGAIVAVLIGFYLLTIHPLFALLFIVGAAGGLIWVARWESRRVGKQKPPEDA